MERPRKIRVGCAGWSLRKEYSDHFPTEGTHLGRYSARFPAVEINSSFHRSHRPATYARWADSVPEDFRFSVKLPKVITHERRLKDVEEPLDRFLGEATQLGGRLGPVLVQLPPSLSFSSIVAKGFFVSLRDRFAGDVALEPRHPSWFEPEADRLVTRYRIARVAADPAVVPLAAKPGGWDGLVYHRLHGSPQVYHSAYSVDDLANLAKTLTRSARTAEVWCVFDNTADGAATANALDLLARVRPD
ncbi:MAG: DUF72 domain-containing protein [Isosphaeraceae bacterium]